MQARDCGGGEWAECRDELYRPVADTNGLAFGFIAVFSTEPVDRAEGVNGIRIGNRHEDICVQSRNSLGIAHLRDGAENRIVCDDACFNHLVEQYGNLLHATFILLSLRRIKRTACGCPLTELGAI